MNRREIVAGAAALAACSRAKGQPERGAFIPPPFPMRRGVNLGNALEAPNEGEWGYRIEGAHLRAIADAGFDGVRLPVRWDAHMDASGAVDPRFMERVHEITSWAIDLDLIVQLDAHHNDTLIADPLGHRARFLSLWRQIAESFVSAPPTLMFEPLNEPNGDAWSGETLTQLQADVIGVIRESNASRRVVLGPASWQSIDALGAWTAPQDTNLAVSVHYYEPHDFTHQRAEWLGDEAPVFDRAWGTRADRAAVRQHIEQAARWAQQHGCSMQIGEFGVNRAVPIPQRAAWTRAVRQACEANGMGWCIWDFAGAFPIWDRERGQIIPMMRDALFA